MKTARTFANFLAAWLLATGISLGGALCISTAYGLESDPKLLLWVCGGTAGVFALLQLLPRRPQDILTVLLWAVGLFWMYMQAQTLWDSWRYVTTVIGERCASGYAWFPVPNWKDPLPAEITAAPVQVLWGILLAQCTAWVAMQRRFIAVALVPGILSLGVCLILVDTLPDHGPLFLLLISLCLLVLTHTAGKYSTSSGGLVLALLVPVSLLVVGISVWQPEESYKRGDFIRQVQMFLTSWVDETTGANRVAVPRFQDAVNLGNQGNLQQTHQPVMDVISSYDGELYLRGQAFTVYTGKRWENDPRADVPDAADSFLIGRRLVNEYPSDSVKITTRRSHDVVFTPYNVMLGVWYQNLHQDTCVFSEGEEEYTLRFVHGGPERFYTAKQLEGYAAPLTNYEIYVQETYLQLPETTREYLTGVMAEKNIAADPNAIADYVSTMAEYSLETSAMPAAEDDFVIWFMEECDTGYCVHFASTAVAMLRTAGIPARYATGYVVDCHIGHTTTVSSDTAHAWAEYYVDGFGWVPLEVTPGGAYHPVYVDRVSPRPSATPKPTPRPTPTPSVSSRDDDTVSRHTGPKPSARPTVGGKDAGFKIDWRWLVLPAAALLVVGAFLLRRLLGLWYLRRQFTTGPVNRRALRLWWNICDLSKELGETPPKSLEELAKKAYFSQHTLSREEMKELHSHRKFLLLLVEQLPRERRFFLRYIKTLC